MLKDYVQLVQGVNPTRHNKLSRDEEYYDQQAFEADLMIDSSLLKNSSNENTVQEGDVLINQMKQKAVIVSKKNAGKVFTINFIKVIFLDSRLDKKYFVYLYNENEYLKKQKDKNIQGSTLQKIPLHLIEQFDIPILPIEEQKRIGDTYFMLLSLIHNTQERMTKHQLLTRQILEKYIQERSASYE